MQKHGRRLDWKKTSVTKGAEEELLRYRLVLERKVRSVSSVSHVVVPEEKSKIPLLKRQGSSEDKWLIMFLEDALICHSENLKVCLL
jgi:hypothetical protein